MKEWLKLEIIESEAGMEVTSYLGRARPRVIRGRSLALCSATASAKRGGRHFRMDFLRKGNAASDLVNRQA